MYTIGVSNQNIGGGLPTHRQADPTTRRLVSAFMERASGVLMPVSSLPGPYGIGGFGWNAYDFVDFLASCKQHYWQILPLTTTSYGDSPYQSFSARAGNPNLIDFAELIEAGYLEQRDIDGVFLGSDPSNVDYGAIFVGRRQILDRAAERFAADKPTDFDDFIQANEDWLLPYCEFMTVKEECGLKAFWEWPEELRRRGEASSKVCATHPERMLYHQMTQYFFDRQWSRLKAYANEHDILIIGDLPSTSRATPSRCGPRPSSLRSTPPAIPSASRERRLISSRPPASTGATPSMTGMPWKQTASPGGRTASEPPSTCTTSSVWTTSAALKPFGRCRSPLPIRHMVHGRRDRPQALQGARGKARHASHHCRRPGFLTPGVIDMRDTTGFPGMKILQFAFEGSNSYYLPTTTLPTPSPTSERMTTKRHAAGMRERPPRVSASRRPCIPTSRQASPWPTRSTAPCRQRE